MLEGLGDRKEDIVGLNRMFINLSYRAFIVVIEVLHM